MEDSAQTPTALYNTLSNAYWEQRWQIRDIGWHQQDGNPKLSKNLPTIMGTRFAHMAANSITVFLPLCGKSKDLLLFYKFGCTVVGVEFVAASVYEFFAENELVKKEERHGNHLLISTEDGRLNILVGDLFSFSPADLPFGSYHVIYDRGSLEALNMCDRKRYVDHLLPLMEPTIGCYILIVKDFPKEDHPGPPLSVTPEEVQSLYGEYLCIEAMETTDEMAENAPRRQKWVEMGMTRMTETLYVFTSLASGNALH